MRLPYLESNYRVRGRRVFCWGIKALARGRYAYLECLSRNGHCGNPLRLGVQSGRRVVHERSGRKRAFRVQSQSGKKK